MIFDNKGLKVLLLFAKRITTDKLLLPPISERVFNKKKYPDFEDWVIDNYGDLILGDGSAYQIARRIKESKSKEDQKVYQEWIKLIGGEKNAFLRDFLKNFRLA